MPLAPTFQEVRNKYVGQALGTRSDEVLLDILMQLAEMNEREEKYVAWVKDEARKAEEYRVQQAINSTNRR